MGFNLACSLCLLSVQAIVTPFCSSSLLSPWIMHKEELSIIILPGLLCTSTFWPDYCLSSSHPLKLKKVHLPHLLTNLIPIAVSTPLSRYQRTAILLHWLHTEEFHRDLLWILNHIYDQLLHSPLTHPPQFHLITANHSLNPPPLVLPLPYLFRWKGEVLSWNLNQNPIHSLLIHIPHWKRRFQFQYDQNNEVVQWRIYHHQSGPDLKKFRLPCPRHFIAPHTVDLHQHLPQHTNMKIRMNLIRGSYIGCQPCVPTKHCQHLTHVHLGERQCQKLLQLCHLHHRWPSLQLLHWLLIPMRPSQPPSLLTRWNRLLQKLQPYVVETNQFLIAHGPPLTMLNSPLWSKTLVLVHLGKQLVLDSNVILNYARWDGLS